MAQVSIRVESVNEGEAQVGVPSQRQAENDRKQNIAVASIFAHQAINMTKQIVNYSINNIDNFSGDYIRQERVQETVNALSDLATLGVAFATNPIAGMVAVAGLTTKTVFGIITQNQQIRHEENNARYLRERSGNSTKNGSRTGD